MSLRSAEKRLTQIVITAASLAMISACVPATEMEVSEMDAPELVHRRNSDLYAENSVTNGELRTGGRAPGGRAFTSTNGDGEVARQALEGDAQTPESKLLAGQIQWVSVQRGQSGSGLDVSVLLNQGQVRFPFSESDLSAGFSLKTVSSGGSDYRASLVCRGLGCNTLELNLQRLAPGGSPAATGTPMAHIMVHRGQAARSESMVSGGSLPANSILSPISLSSSDRSSSAKKVSVDTFEVSWGSSGFQVEFRNSGLCLRGYSQETVSGDIPLSIFRCGSSTPSGTSGVQAALIGNDSRGEWTMRLEEARDDALASNSNSPRLYLTVALDTDAEAETQSSDFKPGSKAGSTAASPEPSLSESQKRALFTRLPWFLPVSPNNPSTLKVIASLSRPEVVARRKKIIDDRDFSTFAVRLHANRDQIFPQFSQAQVPAEFALIYWLESRFFVDPQYPVEVSRAGAIGVAQMLPGTAREVGLNPRPLKRVGSKKIVDPCDDLARLDTSVRGSSRYVQFLLEKFSGDPLLAVAAYNLGYGGLTTKAKASRPEIRRAEDIARMGLSFWEVARRGMSPGSETFQYVVGFVAALGAASELTPNPAGASAVEPWRVPAQCL